VENSVENLIGSSTITTTNNPPTLLSETEVYSKVAQLFTNHEDLLAEFSQFLPDASQQPTVNSNKKQKKDFFFLLFLKERTNSISDILLSSSSSSSSSGTSTPPIHSTTNSIVSNPPPRLIINNTLSSSFPTSSSFTVVSSTTNKDEISHPLSPKQMITSTINTNKRSVSSLKSPGITKKKRLTITNNISTISSNINDKNIRDTTGQNKKLPSMDEIAFFDKVIFISKKKSY
jgi:hypothetical protein